MNLSHPIDTAVLADYWLGALAGQDEEFVEEHLFECDQCGARLREVVALAEAVRRLAREGDLRMVVSDTFLQRAAQDGLRVREYAPPSGGSVQCTVTEDDDLMIGRLAANLSGARRIDLCWWDEHGAERVRLQDIPFRADAASIILQEPITWMKASPTTTQIARLLAVDDTGTERLLGEFTFHHTRTLPGPGAW
jgi:Putative zinc-finger